MNRILIFATAYLPWVGGAEIAVKEITDRLPDIEFDMITVNLTGEEPPVERRGNVVIHRIGKGTVGKFMLPVSGLRLAEQLHAKRKYTAVWGIMASHGGITAARFKKSHPEIPFILTLQEGDEESYLMRYVFNNKLLFDLFIRPFHHLPIRTADKITAISTYLKNRALAAGATCPIEIIPNGVDVAMFSHQFTDQELWPMRETIGKNGDEKYIITASRLVEKNSIVDLVDAMTHLPENIRLLICGVGPLQASLINQVERLKLTNRVRFFGYVPHERLPLFLHVSDVFVRPSLSEGMGNSFIEAMASRLPVVGTAVGGITDFLKNEVTGVVCEVKDPRSIASSVEWILSDENLRANIISNAHALAVERFDWRNIAGAMGAVLESSS